MRTRGAGASVRDWLRQRWMSTSAPDESNALVPQGRDTADDLSTDSEFDTAVPEVAAAVTRYSRRFIESLEDGSASVVAPIGAWLLVALVAEQVPVEIARNVLGLDPSSAVPAARALLASPHPSVKTATAVWMDGESVTDELAQWASTLPLATACGAKPSQSDADSWVQLHTDGQLSQLPASLEGLAVVLVSVLATRVLWSKPFDVVAGDELGSQLLGVTSNVLSTPALDGAADGGPEPFEHFLADTPIGACGVHVARAVGDLAVVSVIADPSRSRTEVTCQALRLASMLAHAPGHLGRSSVFDFPTGDRGWLSIVEDRVRAGAPDRTERYRSLLPAWQIEHTVRFDQSPELGAPMVAAALSRMLGQPSQDPEAVQSAVARFDRYGFAAAAVTAEMLRSVGPPVLDHWSVRRTATIRFQHPYAAVAVVLDPTSPWHGLPVFCAWVTEAVEIDAASLTGSSEQSPIDCPGCGAANPSGTRFCSECGAYRPSDTPSGAPPLLPVPPVARH